MRGALGSQRCSDRVSLGTIQANAQQEPDSGRRERAQSGPHAGRHRRARLCCTKVAQNGIAAFQHERVAHGDVAKDEAVTQTEAETWRS